MVLFPSVLQIVSFRSHCDVISDCLENVFSNKVSPVDHFHILQGREIQEDPELKKWRLEKEQREAEIKKENQEDSVDSYERAWERIREITGEEEVDLLVRRFIEVEDRNFALFNYVNEQHNEIELLQEQIQQVKSKVVFT